MPKVTSITPHRSAAWPETIEPTEASIPDRWGLPPGDRDGARRGEVAADADFFEFDGRARAEDAVPPFDRGVPDRPARLVAVVTVGNRVVP